MGTQQHIEIKLVFYKEKNILFWENFDFLETEILVLYGREKNDNGYNLQ